MSRQNKNTEADLTRNISSAVRAWAQKWTILNESHFGHGRSKIKSDNGHSIDLESFLMSQVTVGHESESEVGLPFLHQPRFRSPDPPRPSSLRMTPVQYCAISLSLSWPDVNLMHEYSLKPVPWHSKEKWTASVQAVTLQQWAVSWGLDVVNPPAHCVSSFWVSLILSVSHAANDCSVFRQIYMTKAEWEKKSNFVL